MDFIELLKDLSALEKVNTDIATMDKRINTITKKIIAKIKEGEK